MGVRILYDNDEGACFFDSTTDTAFGPVFRGIEGHPTLDDPLEEAEAFLTFVSEGIQNWRSLFTAELLTLHADWQELERRALV